MAHHSDHHAHHHSRQRRSQRALTIALAITSMLMVVEVAGGFWTGSLALLADAGHMLSDVVALALSLVAVRLAARPPSQRHSFGYHRSEVLAALINGAALLVVALVIVVEALERLADPHPVLAGPMLAIAVAGLLANLIGAWVLSRGGGGLNERGALLHVLADALGSVAAIVAASIIALTGWLAADPLLSIITTVLIAFGGLRLIRDTVHVLMEGVPSHMELAEVQGAIEQVDGVGSVHDLHIWSVTSGLHALSGHVEVKSHVSLRNPELLLSRIHQMLAQRFDIHHTTVQLEPPAFSEQEETQLSCNEHGCSLIQNGQAGRRHEQQASASNSWGGGQLHDEA